MQGISFAERLCEGGEKVRELIVAVNVSAVFLHGVLYFQDSRIFARLGIDVYKRQVYAFGTGGKRKRIFQDIYFSVEETNGVGVLYTKTTEIFQSGRNDRRNQGVSFLPKLLCDVTLGIYPEDFTVK